MTPAEAKKIYKMHAMRPYSGPMQPHPLDGKSVAEWVQEARRGWPRVPVPADPYKAAQKVAEKYAPDPNIVTLELS